MDKDAKDKKLSRRDFLKFTWGSARTQAGKVVADGLDNVDALIPKTPRRGFTGRVRIGARKEMEALPVASAVTSFSTTEWFFLVRVPEGWLALYNMCTHMGCRLTWERSLDGQARLVCKTDGSVYDMYGDPTRGPAAYPLQLFPLEQDADGVYVRTDTLRNRLAADHAEDPTKL